MKLSLQTGASIYRTGERSEDEARMEKHFPLLSPIHPSLTSPVLYAEAITPEESWLSLNVTPIFGMSKDQEHLMCICDSSFGYPVSTHAFLLYNSQPDEMTLMGQRLIHHHPQRTSPLKPPP